MRRIGWSVVLALLIVSLSDITAEETCNWMIVDITRDIVTDDSGAVIHDQTTYWWGWNCTYTPIGNEYPHPPGANPPPVGPPPVQPPPPPPPPPPPASNQCSLKDCLGECAAQYLKDAGVEVLGDGIIEHQIPGVTCGILCLEAGQSNYQLCQSECTADCNLP